MQILNSLDKSEFIWYNLNMNQEFKRSVYPISQQIGWIEPIIIGRGVDELNLLKSEIISVAGLACRDLGIKVPNLEIVPRVNGEINFGYDTHRQTIIVTIWEDGHWSNPIFWQSQLKKDLNLNSVRKIILFALFHEIGHAWHHQKKWKHWMKFSGYYKPLDKCDLQEYSEQHLERIADKIGYILFKRYGL